MNLTCRPQLPGRDWRKRVEDGLDWGLKVEEKLELILWAKNPANSADGSSFGLLQKASPKLAMEYQLHCLEFQTKIDLGIFWHVDFQKGIWRFAGQRQSLAKVKSPGNSSIQLESPKACIHHGWHMWITSLTSKNFCQASTESQEKGAYIQIRSLVLIERHLLVNRKANTIQMDLGHLDTKKKEWIPNLEWVLLRRAGLWWTFQWAIFIAWGGQNISPRHLWDQWLQYQQTWFFH